MDPITEPLIEEGIISAITGIMSVTIIAGMVDAFIPRTINYEVERLEWFAPQPLYPGKEFDFELKVRNSGSRNTFTVKLYFDGIPTGHEYTGTVGSNKIFSCTGSLTMPETTGIHYMTAEITIGSETETYPVSTVYIARYSIEQMHWKRSTPPGQHTPPYINIGEPVGALRPGVRYGLNFRIRNNEDVSRYYRFYATRLGVTHTGHFGIVQPGELSYNSAMSFEAEEPGVYPIMLRVYADDVNDFHPHWMHLTDSIVAAPPVDFLVGAAEWDGTMPFDLHTLQSYEFDIENLGQVGASFSIDVYLDHKMNPDFGTVYVGKHSGAIQSGNNMKFKGSLITPTYYGRTYLLIRVVVDGIFEEWYVISHVDTGKRMAIDGLGDLNDDGYVTWADIDIFIMYIMGHSIPEISSLPEAEFLRRADINEDGVVNLGDLIRIRRFIYEGVYWE